VTSQSSKVLQEPTLKELRKNSALDDYTDEELGNVANMFASQAIAIMSMPMTADFAPMGSVGLAMYVANVFAISFMPRMITDGAIDVTASSHLVEGIYGALKDGEQPQEISKHLWD